ncbi:MAG: Mur ligase domain-containing protein, partial [Kiritimatiellaeota bacterium]|nr:Mur ligase domain-containing protein [Kiritimatiellota bacterium]
MESVWQNGNGSSVHLMGICGVGMAGLAHLLARRGWRVSGCDSRPNALADWLRRGGVEIFGGHSPEHLPPPPAPAPFPRGAPGTTPGFPRPPGRGPPLSPGGGGG